MPSHRGVSEILLTEDDSRVYSEFPINPELGNVLLQAKMKKQNRLGLYFKRTTTLTDKAILIYCKEKGLG